MTDRLDAWKRIVLDPCNASVQRRNTAAVRDSLEQIVNYITNINQEGGADEIVFFEVQEDDIGDPDNDGVHVKALDLTTFGATGVDYTLYDYTPNKRFVQNFVQGFRGVGRISPEIGELSLVVIELEGMARWIDGTLTEDWGATAANSIEASVENYWGAFPNIHDPGATVTVYDRDHVGFNAKEGDRFLAVWDEKDQEYILVKVNDEEVVFFRVKDSTGQFTQSTVVEELEFTQSGTANITVTKTGREFIAYDYTPNLRFAPNFVEDYYGVGRHAPELDDALIVMEVEGLARFIDGEFLSDMIGGFASGRVDHFWGAHPNVYDPGSPVQVWDPNRLASDAKTGDAFIAIWDEQRQKYILIVSKRDCPCGFSGEVEYIRVCNTDTNSCCLWDGVIKRLDAERTDNFCAPEYCFKPIWIWDFVTAPNGEGVTFPMPCPPSYQWCGYGMLLKRGHDCNGDIRDVYAVMRDSCCECFCPGTTVKVTIPAFDCQPELVFNATCVTKNPMEPEIEPGWWGEFEYTGEYPLIGRVVNIDPLFPLIIGGENIDSVYVVLGCNTRNLTGDNLTFADFCRIDRTFYNPVDSDEFVEYFGDFTSIGTVSGPDVPILDSEGHLIFCSRKEQYGLFFKCSQGNTFGATLYHLSPEGDRTLNIDACTGTLQVPGEGEHIGDANGSDDSASGCCDFQDASTHDTVFGGSYSCDSVLSKDTNNLVFNGWNPWQYHVLGGCRATIAAHFPALAPYIPAVDPGETIVTFDIDWSGTDECKEL